tara:strand:- start:6475 stop:7137 length:663 start_codon:yes stop_codon:yes gene_type:complete
MAGGKGGSQTTTTNFTPEMEQGIADAINLARKSARAYMPLQGATLAAKTGGMMAGDEGLNLSRDALGLSQTTSSLPEAQNYNGVMAYSSFPMFQAEMARAEQNYPDLFNQIKSLQEDPFGMNATPGVSAPMNAGGTMGATGGGVMSAAMNNNEDNPFPYHGKTPDMFDGGMLFGNNDQPTTLDFAYNPVSDFVDYISGGYDYPEMTQADMDYYNSPEFGK